MASAVLASRNEPQWGDQRVHMRKTPISNPHPYSKLGSIHNPNPNSNFAGDVDSEETPAVAAVGAAVSDDCSSFSRRPTAPAATTAGRRDGDYVTFDIGSFSRRQRRELKRRLVSELEQVRAVVGRFHSHSSPSNYHLQRQPSQAQQKEELAIMKRCCEILTKLMKQKGARWFNHPVDIEGMGLHDYRQIIKNPMDLGTVKAKLRKGVYGAPVDFASDVRLTFNNALVYNPVGHTIHALADQLLKFFDSLFEPAYKMHQKQMASIARAEANQQQQLQPLPLRRPPQPKQPPLPPHPRSNLAKQPPKPKEKSLNKRPMSLQEIEKLRTGLQSLPQEMMEQVVNIVRRRNDLPAQDGDEIELDFELMGTETLWELDRFLSNCKKSINKIKRPEATATTTATPAAPSTPPPLPPGDKLPAAAAEGMQTPAAGKNWKMEAGDEDVDIGEDLPATNYPRTEIDKNDGDNSSSSSGSSSSSSSSDSDSDSSSDSDSEDSDN